MLSDFFASTFLAYRVGSRHEDKTLFTYYQYPNLESQTIPANNIPTCNPNHVRLVIVADTHTRHNCLDHLPPCDILIHGGDIMMTGRILSSGFQVNLLKDFDKWIGKTMAKHRLVIAGNHDHVLGHVVPDKSQRQALFTNAQYMENDFLCLESIKIFGTPVSHGKSQNQAFQSLEFFQEAMEQTAKIAACEDKIDVLLTHGFSPDLERNITHNLHICGHYHAMYGVSIQSIAEEYQDGTWHERSTAKVRRSKKHHHDDTVERQIAKLEEEHGNRTGNMRAKRVRICAPICDGSYNLTHFPIIVDYPRALLR